jgi:adenylate cyclase
MPSVAILRRLRLVSGLILLLFVFGHLCNAALGLVSIEAMEMGRAILLRPWQTWPGLVLLYGALALHVPLGIVSVFRRPRLSPAILDLAQIACGLLVPFFLVAHVAATRLARSLTEFRPDYEWILAVYWRWAPNLGLEQVLLVAIVWVHACIGLLTWLNLRRWWPRIAPIVYPAVFALPVLALLGFVNAGNEALRRLDDDPAFLASVEGISQPALTVLPTIEAFERWFIIAYLGVAGLALSPALGRWLGRRLVSRPKARLTYVDGPQVEMEVGATILDASRRHHIPHSSVCSGQARCGTCRVRVEGRASALSPPRPDEIAKLVRLHAPPDVRLACQARIRQPAALTIERLVPIDVAEVVARSEPLPDLEPLVGGAHS